MSTTTTRNPTITSQPVIKAQIPSANTSIRSTIPPLVQKRPAPHAKKEVAVDDPILLDLGDEPFGMEEFVFDLGLEDA